MRKRPLLLPTLLVLGLLGAWAGTGAGQLPPPPTVSLPTVTVPSAPLPPAPPPPPLPTVTTPIPTPPTPAPPTLPVEPPAAVPPTPAPSTPSAPQPQPAAAPTSAPAGSQAREGFGASSRFMSITSSPFSPSRVRPLRPDRGGNPVRPRTTTLVGAPTPSTAGVHASSRLPVKREPPDGALGATLGTLRSAAGAVPPALFALALLAVMLLFVAAMPQPLRASWAGAALVHHRGTIAIAGVGVLAAAILSAGLLL
jgi:hypothetical protein